MATQGPLESILETLRPLLISTLHVRVREVCQPAQPGTGGASFSNAQVHVLSICYLPLEKLRVSRLLSPPYLLTMG